MPEKDPRQRGSSGTTFEQRLEYVRNIIDRTRQVGEVYMATFIPRALESAVPRDFSTASARYVQGLADEEDIDNNTIIAAEHLTGVTCHNQNEAIYLLGLAGATSIIKQLYLKSDEENEDISPEQFQTQMALAEEMLGSSMIMLHHSGTETRGIRRCLLPKRYREKRERMSDLAQQMEQNFTKPMYHTELIFWLRTKAIFDLG